jgi:hypothetical protein
MVMYDEYVLHLNSEVMYHAYVLHLNSDKVINTV